MPVANTKSVEVTNAEKTPIKFTDALVAGGRLRERVAWTTVAVADDDLSVYRLHRVHSSWRLSSLELLNDAITGGIDYDLGLYDIAEDGGAAVNVNLFADAVTMAAARVAPLDVLFEALNITDIEAPIWQMLGLASDPGKFYEVAWTAVTVGTAAGNIASRLHYCDGS